MHIEISAGGISGAIAVAELQLHLNSFADKTEKIISSFQAVTTATANLNGGVGNLRDAFDQIDARVRTEQARQQAVETVCVKTNDFLELAIRVDEQAARLVNQNRDAFYRLHPWLKPEPPATDDRPWYEKAWDWLCDAGEFLVDTIVAYEQWKQDIIRKAWDGLVEFYQEHKKIIDTVLIVIGAVVAIAAVVASGGGALIPILAALGVSAEAAAVISGVVAVVAVVSTVASSTMDISDIWCEIDDPTFQNWKTALKIVRFVSNGIYSIGRIYNKFHHITPADTREMMKNTLFPEKAAPVAAPVPASGGDVPASTDEAPIKFSQDSLSETRYYAEGNHYDDFKDFWENGDGNYTYTSVSDAQPQLVDAKDIEGVWLSDNELKNPDIFWDKRFSKAEYLDFVSGEGIHNKPVEVTKVNDLFYYFSGDGRHRILAAQELNIQIPVIIKGIYSVK